MNETYRIWEVRNTVPDFWSMEGVLAYEEMYRVATNSTYVHQFESLETERFYENAIENCELYGECEE